MRSSFKIHVNYLTDSPCAWSNLGFWSLSRSNHTQTEPKFDLLSYPVACARLASWVADFAGIQPSRKILDLGVGYGASVRFWLEHYRAISVDAVELRSDALAQLTQNPPLGLGNLIVSSIESPSLYKHIPSKTYQHIVCIDALYHLNHPSFLWRLAHHALEPDGSVGVCTLMRTGSKQPSLYIRNLLRFAQVNPDCLPDPDQLQTQMTDAGLSDMRLEWGTESVLKGFCKFVQRRRRELSWYQRASAGWSKISATAHLADTICHEGTLGYATITAKRLNT